MAIVKVYRIEHPYDGLGLYRSSRFHDTKSYDLTDYKRHPLPSKDSLFMCNSVHLKKSFS